MIFQFGAVTNPLDVLSDGKDRSLTGGAGLINFGSNIIRLIILAAGVFALFNFITAGLDYITSQGDPQKVERAQSKITMSIIGLTFMAASFMLSAVISWLLFGNPMVFLNPTLYTPD